MEILFWYSVLSIFILGTIVGSFLNCAIWRSYANESVADGRSYCPECRHKLSWLDLIPVVSFLCLRGKCRYCSKPISIQYPIVELVSGIFFVAAALVFAPTVIYGYFNFFAVAKLVAYWVVLSSLLMVFTADLRWYIIPDGAVIAGFAGALVLSVLRYVESGVVFKQYDPGMVTMPLLTAVAAFSFFLAVYLLSRGTWMGFGDVKYAIFMGWFLGFPDILIGLFFAFIMGAILGLAMVSAKKKQMSSEIPFGPFLVAGTIIAMFFSGPILGWYLSIGVM